ncbi:MAG: cytochrome c553 [Oceanicoccus sp.]|jgi:cytochrome c553
MKKVFIPLIAAVLTVSSGFSLAAGDAAKGKSKAGTCVGCHGPAGLSFNTMWPNLAGQKEGYLAKQITAFRDGKRSDPMMSSFAAKLSDEDIANLAAYYSSL